MDYVQNPPVKFFVLPGGKLPKQQSEGAIGYDVHLRAIVSPTEMDPGNKVLRKVLYDFTAKPKVGFLHFVRWRLGLRQDHFEPMHVVCKGGKYLYCLMPGESVLVAIGFITEMEYPLFYWVSPRSGLASRDRINLGNAPGTVDPDYRGEAGVIVVNEGRKPFYLEHNMRIAQIVFQWAAIPHFNVVSSPNELTQSKRGSGGFGSTGVRDLPLS